jgi:restriction system protein
MDGGRCRYRMGLVMIGRIHIMPRRRRDEGLSDVIFGILMAVPIWVGPVLGGVVYVAFRFLWPAAFRGDDPGKAVLSGIGPTVAPWAGLAIIVLWIVAEWRKWQRHKLLDAQTGFGSIRGLSWHEFEHLVGEAYRRQGYLVEETGTSSGDGGIDLVLNGHSEKVLVQCKQWRTQRVGVKPVRELYGVLTSEGADRAILATCGTFTAEAWAFARDKPLKLVAGNELLELVRSGQQAKQRSEPSAGAAATAKPTASADAERTADTASTPTCPKCGVAMVLHRARKGPNAGSRFWGCVNYPRCRVTCEYREP